MDSQSNINWNIAANNVPADDLAPLGGRAYAHIVMFGSHMYMGLSQNG